MSFDSSSAHNSTDPFQVDNYSALSECFVQSYENAINIGSGRLKKKFKKIKQSMCMWNLLQHLNRRIK